MDSSASCDLNGTSLTFFVTASSVGGLPVCMALHRSQSQDNYEKVFEIAKKNISCFMTDMSDAEQKALALHWPQRNSISVYSMSFKLYGDGLSMSIMASRNVIG